MSASTGVWSGSALTVHLGLGQNRLLNDAEFSLPVHIHARSLSSSWVSPASVPRFSACVHSPPTSLFDLHLQLPPFAAAIVRYSKICSLAVTHFWNTGLQWIFFFFFNMLSLNRLMLLLLVCGFCRFRRGFLRRQSGSVRTETARCPPPHSPCLRCFCLTGLR